MAAGAQFLSCFIMCCLVCVYTLDLSGDCTLLVYNKETQTYVNTTSCCTGYEWSEQTEQCEPACDPPCIHGICTEPEKCTCDKGYKMSDHDQHTCLSACTSTCINADCVGPDKCKCKPGYERETQWECKPKCDNCQNGICQEPYKCVCNTGYSNRSGVCSPQCDTPCTNGYCEAPNRCACKPGYKQDANKTCVPDCTPSCVNSTCTAPNICTCLKGYERSTGNVCRPHCESCTNGVCTEPNICKCLEGYERSTNLCVPVCFQPCINSDCVAPSTCECHAGYEKNETMPHICYKPCDDCANGICDIDGQCSCVEGYELFKGNCLPLLPVDCKTCTPTCLDAECRCDDGRLCTTKSEAVDQTGASLAGLELTWVVCAALLLLLLLAVIIVITRLHRRPKHASVPAEDNMYSSVMVGFTAPDTLITRALDKHDENSNHHLLATEPETEPQYSPSDV